jgi:hypothetical protein
MVKGRQCNDENNNNSIYELTSQRNGQLQGQQKYKKVTLRKPDNTKNKEKTKYYHYFNYY